MLVSSGGAVLTERVICDMAGLPWEVKDEMVSVTLLAAVTKLPQTPLPTDPGTPGDFSSLTEVMLLLSFDHER
jgi:hypothetical protein